MLKAQASFPASARSCPRTPTTWCIGLRSGWVWTSSSRVNRATCWETLATFRTLLTAPAFARQFDLRSCYDGFKQTSRGLIHAMAFVLLPACLLCIITDLPNHPSHFEVKKPFPAPCTVETALSLYCDLCSLHRHGIGLVCKHRCNYSEGI